MPRLCSGSQTVSATRGRTPDLTGTDDAGLLMTDAKKLGLRNLVNGTAGQEFDEQEDESPSVTPLVQSVSFRACLACRMRTDETPKSCSSPPSSVARQLVLRT